MIRPALSMVGKIFEVTVKDGSPCMINILVRRLKINDQLKCATSNIRGKYFIKLFYKPKQFLNQRVEISHEGEICLTC